MEDKPSLKRGREELGALEEQQGKIRWKFEFGTICVGDEEENPQLGIDYQKEEISGCRILSLKLSRSAESECGHVE